MSELKFNCPVCGQHIATDSSASGTQLECPTCFQSIIVPQPPKPQSKYMLSATQFIKPGQKARGPAGLAPKPRRRRMFVPELLLLLAVGCIMGLLVYALRSKSNRTDSKPPPAGKAKTVAGRGPDKFWKMDLEKAAFPNRKAAGRIHHGHFTCTRAVLVRNVLSLRQGPARRPERLVNVIFHTEEVASLPGRSFNITTNDTRALPRVVLRWREHDLQVAQLFTNGYAMKLTFGSIELGKMSGRIYLCVPDASKSYVAGRFVADVKTFSGRR